MSTNQGNPGNTPPAAITTASASPQAIVPTRTEFTTSIEAFNRPLAGFLADAGLPTSNILAPLEERRNVIESLANALEVLPYDERQKATYLSRFTVAVSVGLFDGALNYLWNETVAALRRLVSKVDLSYFFSVSGQINVRYAALATADDLTEISEHDMLEACRRMGLLSDVNFKRLEHVNFMRNHASAAHPNDVDISGFELLGWLTNCLRHAITAEPDHAVVTIKRLLTNIRTAAIPTTDYAVIGGEIARLSPPQIDDLLWTLFGMYTDARLVAQAKTNIQGIAGYAWAAASEDRKYEVGSRYGAFRKNGDVDKKTAAEDFLARIDGLRYRDEDSLAADLLAKLQALKTAHFAFHNFYNEWPHAQALANGLPHGGGVPRAARPTWVKVISICYVGNGMGFRQGTDETAVPHYASHIQRFGEAEVAEFLHLFGDPEFTSALDQATPDRRIRELARTMKTRTANVHHLRALDEVISFPPLKLEKISGVDSYKRLLANAPKHQ
jgi:hypothetical protein